MIEKLTQEQEAQMENYVEKWVKIGLNTSPINFERAKAAVKLAYEKAERPAPKEYIYCKSPIEAINLINKHQGTTGYIYTYFLGQHDVNTSAFYNYFAEVCGIDLSLYDGLKAITEECGWCYLYENVAFICDRPKISLDENGELHSESGYGFEFSDGFGGTFWHGTEIPKWIIFEKDKITVEKIFSEKNKEIQRCMIDIYGREKIMEDCGTLIHTDDWGSLYRLNNIKDSFGNPLSFVRVINFSPNETINLTKREIDDIMRTAQRKIKNPTAYRHGDVLIKQVNSTCLSKEDAEGEIKKLKKYINQEIELLWKRKGVQGKIQYRDYYLQCNPECRTAFEAVNSTWSHLNEYLPIMAT